MDGVCFLDWQLARFVSPVFDLHHIIFTATDKPLRDKEYRNLMDHYYHTLTKTIKMLSSDPEIFSRAEFDDHLTKFGPFAVIVAVFVTLASLADSENVADLDEFSESIGNDENVDIIQKFKDSTQLKYARRMRDVVGDLYDLKYFIKSN